MMDAEDMHEFYYEDGHANPPVKQIEVSDYLTEYDIETIGNIIESALKDTGIRLYAPDDSFFWELKAEVHDDD